MHGREVQQEHYATEPAHHAHVAVPSTAHAYTRPATANGRHSHTEAGGGAAAHGTGGTPRDGNTDGQPRQRHAQQNRSQQRRPDTAQPRLTSASWDQKAQVQPEQFPPVDLRAGKGAPQDESHHEYTNGVPDWEHSRAKKRSKSKRRRKAPAALPGHWQGRDLWGVPFEPPKVDRSRPPSKSRQRTKGEAGGPSPRAARGRQHQHVQAADEPRRQALQRYDMATRGGGGMPRGVFLDGRNPPPHGGHGGSSTSVRVGYESNAALSTGGYSQHPDAVVHRALQQQAEFDRKYVESQGSMHSSIRKLEQTGGGHVRQRPPPYTSSQPGASQHHAYPPVSLYAEHGAGRTAQRGGPALNTAFPPHGYIGAGGGASVDSMQKSASAMMADALATPSAAHEKGIILGATSSMESGLHEGAATAFVLNTASAQYTPDSDAQHAAQHAAQHPHTSDTSVPHEIEPPHNAPAADSVSGPDLPIQVSGVESWGTAPRHHFQHAEHSAGTNSDFGMDNTEHFVFSVNSVSLRPQAYDRLMRSVCAARGVSYPGALAVADMAGELQLQVEVECGNTILNSALTPLVPPPDGAWLAQTAAGGVQRIEYTSSTGVPSTRPASAAKHGTPFKPEHVRAVSPSRAYSPRSPTTSQPGLGAGGGGSISVLAPPSSPSAIQRASSPRLMAAGSERGSYSSVAPRAASSALAQRLPLMASPGGGGHHQQDAQLKPLVQGVDAAAVGLWTSMAGGGAEFEGDAPPNGTLVLNTAASAPACVAAVMRKLNLGENPSSAFLHASHDGHTALPLSPLHGGPWGGASVIVTPLLLRLPALLPAAWGRQEHSLMSPSRVLASQFNEAGSSAGDFSYLRSTSQRGGVGGNTGAVRNTRVTRFSNSAGGTVAVQAEHPYFRYLRLLQSEHSAAAGGASMRSTAAGVNGRPSALSALNPQQPAALVTVMAPPAGSAATVPFASVALRDRVSMIAMVRVFAVWGGAQVKHEPPLHTLPGAPTEKFQADAQDDTGSFIREDTSPSMGDEGGPHAGSDPPPSRICVGASVLECFPRRFADPTAMLQSMLQGLGMPVKDGGSVQPTSQGGAGGVSPRPSSHAPPMASTGKGGSLQVGTSSRTRSGTDASVASTLPCSHSHHDESSVDALRSQLRTCRAPEILATATASEVADVLEGTHTGSNKGSGALQTPAVAVAARPPVPARAVFAPSSLLLPLLPPGVLEAQWGALQKARSGMHAAVRSQAVTSARLAKVIASLESVHSALEAWDTAQNTPGLLAGGVQHVWGGGFGNVDVEHGLTSEQAAAVDPHAGVILRAQLARLQEAEAAAATDAARARSKIAQCKARLMRIEAGSMLCGGLLSSAAAAAAESGNWVHDAVTQLVAGTDEEHLPEGAAPLSRVLEDSTTAFYATGGDTFRASMLLQRLGHEGGAHHMSKGGAASPGESRFDLRAELLAGAEQYTGSLLVEVSYHGAFPVLEAPPMEENEAALLIQSQARAFMASKMVSKKRSARDNEAAARLQALYRGRTARGHASGLKKKQLARNTAAVRLQAAFRGSQGRTAAQARQEALELQREHEAAAVKLQATIRAAAARKHAAELRAEKAEIERQDQEVAATRIQRHARAAAARRAAESAREKRAQEQATARRSAAAARQVAAAERRSEAFERICMAAAESAVRARLAGIEAQRQEAAAMAIQAGGRGLLARRQTEAQRTAAATAAAAAAAQAEADAAVRIQAAARGRQARTDVAVLREQREAELEEERAAAQAAAKMEAQNAAAAKMQALARGNAQRKAIAEQQGAAARIQEQLRVTKQRRLLVAQGAAKRLQELRPQIAQQGAELGALRVQLNVARGRESQLRFSARDASEAAAGAPPPLPGSGGGADGPHAKAAAQQKAHAAAVSEVQALQDDISAREVRLARLQGTADGMAALPFATLPLGDINAQLGVVTEEEVRGGGDAPATPPSSEVQGGGDAVHGDAAEMEAAALRIQSAARRRAATAEAAARRAEVEATAHEEGSYQ